MDTADQTFTNALDAYTVAAAAAKAARAEYANAMDVLIEAANARASGGPTFLNMQSCSQEESRTRGAWLQACQRMENLANYVASLRMSVQPETK